MKTLSTLTKAGALLLALSFSIVGCQKTRKASLPYGADRDVMTISDYEGKDYDLYTKGIIKAASSNGLKVNDARRGDKNQISAFNYVDYESHDPLNLLDHTLMLGRANFHYKVRYVFDGNLLKVMKVAKAEDLSDDELATAVSAGKGLKMVPVVSYNVSYFSIDRSRNSLNEKTSQLELVPLQGRDGASRFKVDLNSKTRASFLSKTTVLPANYFTPDDQNEWYVAVTVVSQHYDASRGPLGQSLASDSYGKEAFKVRARKMEDKILFYNLSIDDRLEKSIGQREELQSPVLTIPADFVDYKMGEQGKTTSVQEQSYKDRAWDKRDYSELNLKQVKLSIGDLHISEIKDVQLDNGYFSFSAFSDELGGLVRVSLLNQKVYENKLAQEGAQPYKPKIYFRDDQKLFGFFATQAESLSSFDRSTIAQAEKRVYINRYNPTRKEIIYKLNDTAPAWIDDLVIQAAAAWNATFNAAGLQTRVVVTDKSGKVMRGQPGDLRYSLINIYGDVDGGGSWGGVASSVVDPQTGEVVMATANINVTDRVEGMERTLNRYLQSVKGEFDTRYVLGIPLPSLRPVLDTANKTLQWAGNHIPALIGMDLNIYDSNSRSFVKVNPTSQAQSNSKKFKLDLSNHYLTEESFQVINGNIAEQVKEVCPNLEKYAQNLKNTNSEIDFDKEVPLIKSCAIDLVKPSLVSVILHEMGHTFGLRHNFYGSTDIHNFYAPVDLKLGNKTVKTQWESSSVMDYMSMNYENMTQPGRYDIAAIRWGYENKIEDSKNNVVAVSPNQSTISQVKSNRRSYKYCTDEDVDVASVDPMCARSDNGTDPDLVVKNLILDYDASMALWNHRFNRDQILDMTTAASYRLQEYLMPMRKFYEQWRLILASQAGSGNEYLESFQTKEAYDALVAKATDPKVVGEQRAKLNLKYKDAANRIFNFLMRIAFLPDYSCITVRTIGDQKTIQMFSFAKIQSTLATTQGKTVTSCQDQEVQDYLRSTKNAKVFADGGYTFNNIYNDPSKVQVSLSNYNVIDRPDTVGIAQDRAFAIAELVSRHDDLYYTRALFHYAPNFMDEQPFRAALTNKVVQRLTQGVPVQDFGIDKLGGQTLPVLMSPSFEVEKPILELMFEALRYGQVIPNKSVITNKRLEQYAIVPSYMLSSSDADNAACALINGYNWCATDIHPISKSLIEKLNSLQSMKVAINISDDVVHKFTELTKDIIPADGKFDTFDITSIDKVGKRIDQIGESDPQLAKQLQLLMSVTFNPEVSIWKEGVNKQVSKLVDEDISTKEMDKKFDIIKKIKIKDLVEKLDLKDYKQLTPEIFNERLMGFIQNMRMKAQRYAADPTELDAQADIILNSLMSGRSF